MDIFDIFECMNNNNRNIVLDGDGYNIDDISDKVSSFINSNWKVGYYYDKNNYKKYNSKNISSEFKNNIGLNMPIWYVYNLIYDMEIMNYENINKFAESELVEYNKKGQICIYASVLLACLFVENELIEKDNIKLVQGFFKHKSQGIWGELCHSSDWACGVHSFLKVKDYVIDLSICQEKTHFDFPDGKYCIIGEIYDGMELYGWEENFDMIMNYAKEIAKFKNMEYDNWIIFHRLEELKKIDELIE